jgi:hypothetical protein
LIKVEPDRQKRDILFEEILNIAVETKILSVVGELVQPDASLETVTEITIT